MKKIKFQNYNDGLLLMGNYIDTYDTNGNAMEEKEFIKKGKLFFSLTSIREQDRYNYDTDKIKITLKLKVKYNPVLKSNYIIKIDNKLYKILHLDRDSKKENLYVYLSDYKDNMSKHIDILIREKAASVLEDDKFILFKKVWGNTESSNEKERVFTIRYLKALDIGVNSLKSYRISFNNKIYKINSIINKNADNLLLEIKGELL